MSGKEISRIIDKYNQSKKPDLSYEAKATLEMLKPDRKISEIVQQERELLTEDIDKLELVPSHGDDSGIFKSEPGNEMLTLKEKSRLEARRLSIQLDLDEDTSMGLVKEYVMFKKKDEELQAKFEEKKVKQNKLKTLKKTLSNIRQNEFQIKEEEYDEIKNVINKKIKDGFFGLLNPVQKLGNLTDKDNYFEKKFQIYKHKTEKNMTRVLMERFAKLNTHILQITGGHAINVVKVLLNDGLTVLDVFWEYEFDLHSWDIQMRPNQRRAQTDEVSRKLETYARSHISFKMMREMNLRKMVEVRFYFSQAVKIKDKITDEMQGTLVSMAKDRLAERVAAEGLDPERLTDRDFQRELGFVKMKFEDKIADVIDYKSMRKRYKSQDEGASGEGGQKIKRDAAGKRLRDNRNPDGSRKKVPKVPKSSKFWGALK